MKKPIQAKGSVLVVLPVKGNDVRIERLGTNGTLPGSIRLSGWKNDQPLPGPLELSEKEFIELIHQAIHAGVLSPDFLGKLRERIEI